MFVSLSIYGVLMVSAGSAAVLLTSKKRAERFVTAGIRPRPFLVILPAIQSVIREFGGVLIVSGIVKVAIDTGWLDAELLTQFASPACLILCGTLMLLLSCRQ